MAAGIILVILAGCSGSNAGSAVDAAPTAGATTATQLSTGGTQPSGGSSGLAGGGGATGGTTGGSSDAGGKASTTATSVAAGTSTAGGGGITSTSGMSTSMAGGQAGRSTVGSGGASGADGTAPQGGSALAGKTSDTLTGGSTNLGGSVGGTSASGGGTSRTGPVFPARFVGNIDTVGKIGPDFPKYWDQFTPENAGKWGSVQGGSRTTFNWNTLDTMYAYTQENNIVFKESCFIWGASPPNWVNSSTIVEAAPLWMKTFCERYPNTRLINVVNEPLHMTPGFAAGLGGGNGTTWEWVANSFKMAREACPNAVLILNDYNICEYATDHQKFLDLVTAIKKLDAPLDAIGCQSHDAAKVAVSKFKGYLDDLASQTGLPIYITEFDIGLADDEQQRQQYADYFTMFWDDPNVKGATIWGYIVGRTWRANTGIMSQEGTMRPAMTWLMDFLHR